MSVVAVVIARAGSERLPNKNMLDFHGLPLVAHKVRQLMRCAKIDRVVVGSDSQEILDAVKNEGATTLWRDPEFCDEKSRPWNDVIHDVVSRVHGDVIVWAHCTNPCIKSSTYDRAVQLFERTHHDSIVSVSSIHNHIWWRDKPLNFDPYSGAHVAARDLPHVYYQNGGIFVAKRVAMVEWRYVYGPDPELMWLPADEAIDIDTEADYFRALRAGT
jgi:CMP-N-acetylneuraminic acid synthetase